jgi:heat shock protein HtpX
MRHVLYMVAATIGLALSLSGLAFALEWSGLFPLLDVSARGFVEFSLAAGWIGGITCWFLARSIAVWSLAVRPYDDEDRRRAAGDLTPLLARAAERVGLKHVPDLGTYDSTECNAFAVGWLPSRSLVVVSTAVLDQLSPSDIEAMLTQRLVAVKNRDVSVLILLNGILNVFTIYPARMLAFLFGTSLRTFTEETPSDDFERGLMAGLEIVVAGFASLAVRHFARGVEARADRSAAELLGDARMVAALAASERHVAKKTHREVFVFPLKFAVLQSPKTRWLSYHQPVQLRRAALTRYHVG